jgi:hypothetical protein
MATYKPIQSVVLASNTANVTFSGIDQSYTDLRLVISVRSNNADTLEIPVLRYNGDTGSNYSRTILYGDGSTLASARSSNQTYIGLEYTVGDLASAGTFGLLTFDIPSYSSSILTKQTLIRINEPNSTVRAQASLWRSSSPITSISFTPGLGTAWSAGSTFSLYGIKSGGSPQALGGDVVTTDGTYWYHTFRTTQTFTPYKPLTADILVVAGGGGGGSGLAGGGGGGGFRTTSALSIPLSTGYTITVGAGGAAGLTLQSYGYNGSNSSVSGSGITTFISTGGGGGGAIDFNGLAGGSGGGGGGSQGSGTTGGAGNSGSYSPVEGYAGGNGVSGGSPYHISGGGGGAGGVGTNATSSAGGNGGNGAANSYSGSSVTYAGGGGGAGRRANSRPGGTGGTGGGGSGAGSTLQTATAGTANLGGGGGGGDWNDSGSVFTGGAGGSGIVIVRYAV